MDPAAALTAPPDKRCKSNTPRTPPAPLAAPEFQARGARYAIDTCAPQLRAITAGKIKFHAVTHGHYPGIPLAPSAIPGINTLGFWDACGPQDWGLDPHRNEGIELVFLETGRMLCTVDGHAFPLEAGGLTITRPWQLHCLGDPYIGPGRLHWLVLDVDVRRPNQPWHWPSWVVLTPEDLKELTRKLRHNEHPAWRATPEIAGAFHELAACIQQADTGCRQKQLRMANDELRMRQQNTETPHANSPSAMRNSAFAIRNSPPAPSSLPVSRMIIQLNRLLLGLLEALRQQCRGENPGLTSRRRDIELFLAELADGDAQLRKPWTQRSLAAHCGLGGTAFTQYCRQLTNQSPMDYLNRCRLDRAAQRLRDEPGTPVGVIAEACGFATSQYFATRCRRRFGHTPGELRQGGLPKA